VSLLIRSATVSSIRDLMAAREATDLLIQPNVEAIEIRDWKAYEPAVEAGYAATAAALKTIGGPLTHLRRRRAAEAERKARVVPSPADADAADEAS
jgi:NTE family protein